MMSSKEYCQNRKNRVSEYICVRASFGVFNSFTVKKVIFFTINIKFQVILSSKSGGGGIFVQAIPPCTQKSGGGGGGYIPRDLRQWYMYTVCMGLICPGLLHIIYVHDNVLFSFVVIYISNKVMKHICSIEEPIKVASSRHTSSGVARI